MKNVVKIAQIQPIVTIKVSALRGDKKLRSYIFIDVCAEGKRKYIR